VRQSGEGANSELEVPGLDDEGQTSRIHRRQEVSVPGVLLEVCFCGSSMCYWRGDKARAPAVDFVISRILIDYYYYYPYYYCDSPINTIVRMA
jgi:hypothetical protein